MKDKYLILIYTNTDVAQYFYEYDSLKEAKLKLSALKVLKESIFGNSTSLPIISLKLVKVTKVL